MPTTDDSFDVVEATGEDIHAAIEAGELTASSLVDRYLARIDERFESEGLSSSSNSWAGRSPNRACSNSRTPSRWRPPTVGRPTGSG